MKREGLLFLLIISVLNLLGRTENQNAKSTIHVDVLGEAITPVSIHYDRLIYDLNTSYVSVNAGLGYFPKKDDDYKPILGIPISVSWNLGKKNHHLDLGVGMTYSSGFTQKRTREEPSDPFELIVKSSIYGMARVGYKYQKPTGGFFFKLGITPVVELVKLEGSDLATSYPFFGIGLGVSF